MPNMKKQYSDAEKFRKIRNAQRKRYYDQTAIYGRGPSNIWTAEQDEMIMKHNMTDTEISFIIYHSVGAIQKRRSILSKSQKEEIE